MKHKGFIGMLFVAMCIFALAGCQLARADAGEEPTGDRLIGVFVTDEYLDLFDFEGYLNDNFGGISDGGIITEDQSRRYEGRLYAVLKELELVDEETGETSTTKEYVFEGVNGASYFAATITEEDGNTSYTTTGSDETISDGHTGIFIGDDEEKTTLEGIIYIAATPGMISRYINPVYQGADGRVYAVSGSGMTMDGAENEGGAFSQTIEETTTITENGESKKHSTSVKISLETMFSPVKIAILEMDENGSVLSHREYSPGQVPDRLAPNKQTEYIIVETHKQDSSGNALITRELIGREETNFTTFFRRGDDICVKRWTDLLWE